MALNIETLKNYASRSKNVLMRGRHGVGKTAIINQVFGEVFGDVNVKWKYFSAPTMDPWVDMIGVPKPVKNEAGEDVLKIIPPEYFTGQEEIEAIFIDEINRADEKTLNAIMELIQFRTINGRKFPHLKCVWAAENPGDDKDHNYMVRELDAAQRDRFNIQIDVPYELDIKYFTSKFGKQMTEVAHNWWTHRDNVNRMREISPRKLDDILVGFLEGDDICDYTNKIDVESLKVTLQTLSKYDEYVDIAKTGDRTLIRKTFTVGAMNAEKFNFDRKGSKEEIFDRIYPHIDDEVKEYIRDTFNYVYVSKRLASLTPEIREFFSEMEQRNVVDYDYSNIDDIKEVIKKTTDVLRVKEVATGNIDGDTLQNIFPFKFDPKRYGDSKDVGKMGQALMSDVEMAKRFRDYYRLCLIAGIRLTQEIGGIDKSKNVSIVEFADKMYSIGGPNYNNENYKVSVINRQYIRKAIEDREYEKAVRYVLEDELFFVS